MASHLNSAFDNQLTKICSGMAGMGIGDRRPWPPHFLSRE